MWWSCSTVDDNVSFDANLEVVFSNDSVSFDTLLTDTRSQTLRLTVYNRNNTAIQFSEIFLARGDQSDYSIIINGKEGLNQFDELLLSGDSMLVLVETTITPRNQDLPYLVKDSIVFNWNGNSEHVKLVSWGQDGNKVSNQLLCDVTWTSNRPYILADTVVISPECLLTIDAGARVYFENDAALFIQGTLNAVGDSANHITFTNARFDGVYDRIPGQWNGIYFLEGSTNNEITFADIFNGQIGLRIGTPDDDDVPDVVVQNTSIYNMSFAGIMAFTSDVEATNCLIYNCGSFVVGNYAGGNYSYRHCTFVNDPSFFVTSDPAVQFSDNVVLSDNSVLSAPLSIEMINSIVWGSSDEDLLISNAEGEPLFTSIRSNIIRSVQGVEENFASTSFNFPGFSDPFSFDFSLEPEAFAIDQGEDIGISEDIRGADRDAQPDIGAFEAIEEEE